MLFRVLGIIILVAIAYWLIGRIAPALARDPRWRGLLSGAGVMLLRQWVLRGGAGNLWRIIRTLRFFR